MLVFATEKLALLAMPKTGTTAIEAALAPRSDLVLRNPPILKHTPAYRYQRFLSPYLEACGVDGMESVCLLRHPVSWLGSWYRYRRRDDMDGSPNSTRGVSFDDFVNEYAKGAPQPWANVGNPEKFIRRGGDDIIVDHLFRYEQMDQLISFLQERLQTDISLQQRNVSPDGDLTLTEKTKAKLMRKRPRLFADWDSAGR